MATYEQTDGFVPNKQTPPATSVLGASNNPFTNLFVNHVESSGARLAKVVVVTGVDFVAATAKTVTHNLGTLNPIVQVYGSGTNQRFGFDTSGNVTVAKITACSGTTANALSITVSATQPGAKVVVIG